MKKILFILGIIAFFCMGLQLNSVYMSKNESYLMAGRGCCSHHGGVCGCAGSRARCCDGTLSPSCQCFMDDHNGLQL